MVRILFIIVLGVSLHAKEPFEVHCLECHNKLSVSFEKFYMQYLIYISNKATIKDAMFYYLKNPNKETSLMSPYILKELGIMPKPKMDDKSLKEMIDIYIQRYDLRKELY